jgi:hypothetical protein
MFALVTTAFLLVGASSQAQPVTPSSSAASTPAATSAPVATGTSTAPEKKICRREQEAGSMMGKRICYTQSEWDAIARATGNDAESVLRDYRSRNSSF